VLQRARNDTVAGSGKRKKSVDGRHKAGHDDKREFEGRE
jgi:hypothetical protein